MSHPVPIFAKSSRNWHVELYKWIFKTLNKFRRWNGVQQQKNVTTNINTTRVTFWSRDPFFQLVYICCCKQTNSNKFQLFLVVCFSWTWIGRFRVVSWLLCCCETSLLRRLSRFRRRFERNENNPSITRNNNCQWQYITQYKQTRQILNFTLVNPSPTVPPLPHPLPFYISH